MLIKQKLGNLQNQTQLMANIDWLPLQWYELNKRIQRKKTISGREIALRFLQENPNLTQGDILLEEGDTCIAVQVLPCDCIRIRTTTIIETAAICYEIGNKHLPLFFLNDDLVVPFERPLFHWLMAQGYTVQQDHLPLLYPFKTTVLPHGNDSSLFSKIIKMTSHE